MPEMEARIKIIKKDPKATFYPTPELVIANSEFQSDGHAYTLAWKVDLFADGRQGRKILYIDAISGNLLFELAGCQEESVVGTAETRYHGTQTIITDSVAPMVFHLIDSTRGGGVFTYDLNKNEDESLGEHFVDEDNYWNNANPEFDDVATDVHWGMEKTYDYYLLYHGRDSYDDKGTPIISYVHYDTSWANARWAGMWALFGDGFNNPLASIDIVSHELTHGVTGNSAGLVYRNESGALNESFSDIFGTAVEFFAWPDSADWLIGQANFTLRDMANPNAYSQPDTYMGDMWYTGNGDNGGVHYNSGVQNYWFYLLCIGGQGTNDFGNNYMVDSIGMEKAAAIAYRTLNYYLTSGSKYLDARLSSIQAAEDIYGTCSPEVNAVMNAWYAVGVGSDVITPDLQALAVLAPVSSCDITSSEEVVFSFRNNRTGCGQFLNEGDTIQLGYRIDNNAPVLENYIVSSAVHGGDTITYTFQTPMDLSVAGAYLLDVWAKYKDDIYPSNDAILDFPVTKTYPLEDNDPLTFNFNASADTFFTITNPHSEAAMSFAAAHTGSRGFQLNGKNATPNNVTPVLSEAENFITNKEFHSSVCMCVDATEWNNVLLHFDLRQTFATYYFDVLFIEDYSYAIGLRVLVNGEQIGEQFHPVTNANDPYLTHTIVLDEYAGTNFELCFEGVHFLKKFDLPGDPGDQSYLDNIIVSDMSVLATASARDDQILLYPNPSSGMVCVQPTFENKQLIYLIDPLGRIVYQQEWSSQGELLTLDLSSYAKGLYTLLLKSSSGNTIKQIVLD
jgi:Zn-dependent metalloprotease